MAGRSWSRRTTLAVVGWLAAAVVATGVTLGAVSSIGTGIFGSTAGPLDQQEIADALATLSPTTSTNPSPQPSTTPGTGSPTPEPTGAGPSGERRVLTSPGGTVVAQCTGDGLVEVVSWSPAPGFRVDDAERGPTSEADVEFESDGDESEFRIRCIDGVPENTADDDD